MAPIRQPRTLFDICLDEATEQINSLCLKIERKHKYSFEYSKHELSQISLYFRENFPPKLINKLYIKWIESDISCNPCFGTVILVNAFTEVLHIIPGKEYHSLYISAAFWQSQLIRVENLIDLNFSSICTNELLEIVGKYCVSLVSLNAESTVRKFTDQYGHQAFKLNVTDKGLEHICNLKKLTVLQIDNWHDSSQITESVTIHGIRMLLKMLPNLRNISFYRMGEALSTEMSDVSKLTLRHVHDYAPCKIHMKHIKLLCPELVSLALKFDIDAGPYENEINDVFNEITDSNLTLKHLKVVNCITNPTFSNFLMVKGKVLTSLKLDICNVITHNLIYFIGLHCPNLKVVSFKEIMGTIQHIEVDKRNREMYANLKYLNLTGQSWKPRNILPELLYYCRGLQYLHIECKINDFTETMDKVMNNVLIKNPLQSLYFFHASCYLKFSTLQRFAALPNMKQLRFVKKLGYVTQNDIEVFYSELKDFDIDLTYDDRD